MTVIHPGISETADVVIKAMMRLRRKRYHLEIGRRSFLTSWNKLRDRLYATMEYQEWQRQVRDRAQGMCERHAKNNERVTGKHAHHKLPVSRYPRLALDVKNGEYLCVDCHQSDHPDAKFRY